MSAPLYLSDVHLQDQAWHTDRPAKNSGLFPAAADRQDSLPFLHPKFFHIRPIVSAPGGSGNLGEFVPPRSFDYKSLTSNPKLAKYETLIQRKILHKAHTFRRNRAKESSLWGDKVCKVWKFPDFFVSFLASKPQIWTYQSEIWHNTGDQSTKVRGIVATVGRKHQNRHLNKFDTGAATTGKYSQSHNSAKKISINYSYQ